MGDLPSITLRKLYEELFGLLVRETVKAGGSSVDMLIILESTLAAVIVLAVKEGREEAVLDLLKENILTRLPDARLGLMPVAGQA